MAYSKEHALAAIVVLAIVVVVAVHLKKKNDLPKMHFAACGEGMKGNRAARSRFTSDSDNWPQAGTFGALADTYPYGNYAGGVEMTYPLYNPP